MKLPSELASVHPVFRVSMLKKCIADPESILPIEYIGFNDILSYEKLSVQILERKLMKLRNKVVIYLRYYGIIT